MHQQHEGQVLSGGLDIPGEVKNTAVLLVEHADDHVELMILYQFAGFGGRIGPGELRRTGQVQVNVFLADLRFDPSVFFHDESIVIAAYHQDPADAELDQGIQVFLVGSVRGHRKGSDIKGFCGGIPPR